MLGEYRVAEESRRPFYLLSAPAVGQAVRNLPWAICAITAAAAAFRFARLAAVAPNPFYDAAVRSMSLSWHNFFFGAFDPAGLMSIDKPPLDLWAQVVSVKLFGFTSFALKLPEALAGTLAVPLLYDAVRRAAGRAAGLASALALAVLPASVLTARSDTMDSVMMLLVVAALWLTIRACTSSRRRYVVLAGVAVGLAFNVKVLEGLIAVPALLVLYGLASPHAWRRKLADVALAAGAMALVGLSWAVAVSLAPGRHPWAIGSSDGSVWNAMFVFNGAGKLSGAAGTKPGGPGPFRLLVSTGWHYDVLFGCALFAALALGLAGALTTIARRSNRRVPTGLAPAFGLSLAVWLAVGLVAFDTMHTVHTRYLEALAPALAAAIGCGAAALAGLYGRRGAAAPSLAATMVALAATALYTFSFKPPSLAWAAAALIISAAGAALVTAAGGRTGNMAKWLMVALILASALLFPVHESLSLVRSGANDSGGLATMAAGDAAALSAYLAPRTASFRYEVAVDEPLALAPLIIRDHRPILPLTSFGGRSLTGLEALQAAVRAGAVRYGLVGGYRCGQRNTAAAACGAAARWIRETGVDVTAAAGLTGRSRLYFLG